MLYPFPLKGQVSRFVKGAGVLAVALPSSNQRSAMESGEAWNTEIRVCAGAHAESIENQWQVSHSPSHGTIERAINPEWLPKRQETRGLR